MYIRHFIAFIGSLCINIGLPLLLYFLLQGTVSPQEEFSEEQSEGAVAFNFGQLIATKQIVHQAVETTNSTAPQPLQEAQEGVQEEPQPEPEPKEEPKVIEKPVPKPVVKPVVKKKKPVEKKVVKEKPKKVVKKVKKKHKKKKTNKKQGKPQKASTPSSISSSALASQASGSSKGTNVNSNKRAGSRTIDAYRAGLQRAISRSAQRNYPRQAKRRRQQGIVNVRFSLSRSGVISNIKVVKSSGSSALDKGAIKALQRLGKYKAPPSGFPTSLVVPIRFSLR